MATNITHLIVPNAGIGFAIADVNTAIIGSEFLNKYGLIIDIKNKRLIDPLTKLSTKAERFTGSEPQIKILSASLDSKYPANLRDFSDLTRPRPFNEKLKHNTFHYIETFSPPVHTRARKLNPQQSEVAKQEFQYMLDQGIIIPSKSNWCSPLHMVSKKDKYKWCLCGDYRALNKQTRPDQYSIPNLTSFNENLKGKTILTKLDIQRAYHPISILPDVRHKTAIITNFGTFEFVFMPFGLCNAAQTWMRFIHEMLRGLDYCFVYLDDILFASTDANSHKKHVREVLQRLDDYDHPSQDANLALLTDASDFGLGSSLNEITSDGFKPLGFFSKKLTPAQTKYSAFDREFLATYSAIKYFRHMIEGRVLILYTDHKPLTFAFNKKLDKASPRQLHHLDFISQFTANIRYVPGIDNVPADIFSRILAIATLSTIDYEEFSQMQQGDDELKALLSATSQTIQLKQLRMPGSTTKIYCDISTGTVLPLTCLRLSDETSFLQCTTFRIL
ncbi:hypothetical protein TNCV_1925761 [Trichonephila clavipes]|nr:hypothetical protein TNCV_1925761 [Trichonephila clavipes]